MKSEAKSKPGCRMPGARGQGRKEQQGVREGLRAGAGGEGGRDLQGLVAQGQRSDLHPKKGF